MENFNPEQPSQPETISVQELLAKLSLPENFEMVDLRAQLIPEIQINGERVQSLAEQYHRLAEAETDVTSNPATYYHQQLALMMSLASILHEAGNQEQYLDSLYDAAEYAENMGLESEAKIIFNLIKLGSYSDEL